MRIACIYLPSFPLQAQVRRAPHLVGTAFAVASGVRVVAPSQTAWAAGVRSGMSVAAARGLVPDLSIVAQDPAFEDDAARGLAEALLTCSRIVDVGDGPASARVRAAIPGFGRPGPGEQLPPGADACTHRVLFVAVPRRARGVTFGQKLLGHIVRQGYRARVGIADDCFTAFAAAATTPRGDGRAPLADLPRQPQMFDQACHVVPGGGGAAFLSSLPLSLLPLDPDIARMFETLDVRTLGDFAALPPPSFSHARAGDDAGVDFCALARGDGPAALHALHLDRPVVEHIQLADPVTSHQPLAFVFRTLCDRVWQRLTGRGRGAHTLVLRLRGEDGDASSGDEDGATGEAAVVIGPHRDGDAATLSSPRAMLDALREAVAGSTLPDAILAASLEVRGEAAPARADLDLFALPGLAAGAEAHAATARADRGAAAVTRALVPARTRAAGSRTPTPARPHVAPARTRRGARRDRRRAAQGELRGLFE